MQIYDFYLDSLGFFFVSFYGLLRRHTLDDGNKLRAMGIVVSKFAV